jgi:hypothetical protein
MDVRYAEEADAKMIAVAGAVEKSIVELVDPNPTVAPAAGSKSAATTSDSTPP